ncbi:MAG: DNA polymerase III subunit beta [Candidatus Aerophobetes bacterium]|nr:DNA polymerase III subunit beta [Candidatus Aerophobetes bacterium]
MKIRCKNKRDFVEAVQIVQNALTSTTLPILSHILISARKEPAPNGVKEEIYLRATNLETTIQSCFFSEVIEEGQICLPGDKLFSILRELPLSEIDLETEDNKATIRCGKAIFHLLGVGAEEFPEIPKVPKEDIFSIEQGKLKKMIQKTMFAASLDETRQSLNGVYLEIEGEKATMVATDGRRLSFLCDTHSFTSSSETKFEVIVPLKALQKLIRILGNREVKIGKSERQIFFSMDNILFISQLIEAKFPDYQEVIPKEYKIAISMSRDELFAAIKRISLLSDEKSHLLKFSLKGNVLSINAESLERGYAYEEINVEREEGREGIEIGFNFTYLYDALKNIEEKEARLELISSTKPGVIRPGGNKDYLYVVMPVRIKEEEGEE